MTFPEVYERYKLFREDTPANIVSTWISHGVFMGVPISTLEARYKAEKVIEQFSNGMIQIEADINTIMTELKEFDYKGLKDRQQWLQDIRDQEEAMNQGKWRIIKTDTGYKAKEVSWMDSQDYEYYTSKSYVSEEAAQVALKILLSQSFELKDVLYLLDLLEEH